MQPTNIKISDHDILSILTQIQDAVSFEPLFGNIINILGITSISYHHFADGGEPQTRDVKRYFSYNLPERISNFFENDFNANNDAGVLHVFSTGMCVWLSDMITDPLVLEQGVSAKIERLISDIGDGLLFPLYGPQNRRGYLYLVFGKPKTAFDPIFMWQVQGLAQFAHTKYALMRINIRKKINLTNREIEVLELISLGKTNPEIGIILNISANTVSGYVKQIFLKLGTSDRVTTALRARELSPRF